MKKIINLLLILVVIFSWRYHFINQDKKTKNYDDHLKKAEAYYKMQANLDAYKEYEKAEDYMNEDQAEYILSQKVKILLDEDELPKAKKALDQAFFNKVDIKQSGQSYLNYCMKQEKYKEMNDFFKDYRDRIDLKDFEEKIFCEYQILPGQFAKIKQIGQKMFLVSDKSKDYIIDENARRLFTSYYEEVIGFDEKNKLITVVDKKENFLVDFKKNVRAKFVKGKVNHFIEDSYISVDKKSVLKNRLNEDLLKADYIGNLTGDTRLIIEDGTIKVLDGNLKTKAELKASGIKTGVNNEGIFNDTLIIKNDKMRLYNIKEKAFSKYYDDIDFNLGGFIAVKNKDKWGYLDSEFNEITDFIYDKAASFSNEIGFVELEGKKYFINEDFKVIKECIFDEFINFNDQGVAFAKMNGLWKMIKLIKKVK